jgi:hypothetical protein
MAGADSFQVEADSRAAGIWQTLLKKITRVLTHMRVHPRPQING